MANAICTIPAQSEYAEIRVHDPDACKWGPAEATDDTGVATSRWPAELVTLDWLQRKYPGGRAYKVRWWGHKDGAERLTMRGTSRTLRWDAPAASDVSLPAAAAPAPAARPAPSAAPAANAPEWVQFLAFNDELSRRRREEDEERERRRVRDEEERDKRRRRDEEEDRKRRREREDEERRQRDEDHRRHLDTLRETYQGQIAALRAQLDERAVEPGETEDEDEDDDDALADRVAEKLAAKFVGPGGLNPEAVIGYLKRAGEVAVDVARKIQSPETVQ